MAHTYIQTNIELMYYYVPDSRKIKARRIEKKEFGDYFYEKLENGEYKSVFAEYLYYNEKTKEFFCDRRDLGKKKEVYFKNRFNEGDYKVISDSEIAKYKEFEIVYILKSQEKHWFIILEKKPIGTEIFRYFLPDDLEVQRVDFKKIKRTNPPNYEQVETQLKLAEARIKELENKLRKEDKSTNRINKDLIKAISRKKIRDKELFQANGKKIKEYLTANPDATVKALSEAVNLSRAALYSNYKEVLISCGKKIIKRD